MTIEAVLDASALLTLLQDEPGSERVHKLIGKAGMSAVNLAEVVGKLHFAGMDKSTVAEILDLAIEILPLDDQTARAAGELLPLTKHRGLSLGDRCCLASALVHEVPVITSDRDWGELNVAGIDVEIVQ